MSDLDKTKKLLEDLNIPYVIDFDSDGNTILEFGNRGYAEHSIFTGNGYSGFYCCFTFDKNMNLNSYGVWE